MKEAFSQEQGQKQLPVLRFKPEGYVSYRDDELLDQLKEFLQSSGIDAQNVVYSGFDGSFLTGERKEPPKHPTMFAMNEAGWRQANMWHESNPAMYTDGTPCIGVYDATQLAEIYSHDIPDADEKRMVLENVILGDTLRDLSPNRPISEAVAHIDYPHTAPDKALICYVLLVDED